ncbi:MAG: cytochrome c-type biogenesis protein [Gammaproteobacteria bacterium]|nr:cytochrome c-type biogenesis protein CcmH [Gammaproteobacteria bacterium]MBA3731764.1 cytochrome c-type biogenesis protein CcmH [Gammaproteobacteria bacterium]
MALRFMLGLTLWFASLAQAVAMDAAMTDRYHTLIEEFRCLVCQNESLAESDADLAKDLRTEIQEMLKDGATDAEIVDFLAARYGDFVLYRPQFKPLTYVLWIGPFVLAAAGLTTLLFRIRRYAGSEDGAPLSAREQQRLRDVLDETPKE